LILIQLVLVEKIIPVDTMKEIYGEIDNPRSIC
jgi:hypothetical protein